jgi:glycosyltransferase involved in cell wall biosynthesis
MTENNTCHMKVLIVHNAYRQRGGEDSVFDRESAMLAAAGFSVRRFCVRNDHIKGVTGKITAACGVIANKASIAALCNEVAAFAPDVVHIHNFFPTLSPAAIDALARQGIPTVLTLHNYRVICPGALLMRDGKPCENCVGHTKLSAVIYGCYRGSRIGSAVVAAMGWYFVGLLRKYPRALTLIALTEFAKSRFVADGFPPNAIIVRGNFIADPGAGFSERDRRIVYVGRLSPEKGVDVLVRAARDVDGVIEIIGDGPERARLELLAPRNVVFRGSLTASQVLGRIRSAMALALPSRCYEGFPMVVLEAMATGTPVLASKSGSLAEIVVHQETGLLIPPNDESSWRNAMLEVFQFPAHARILGTQARTRYLQRHSAETGVSSLTEIYERAVQKIK